MEIKLSHVLGALTVAVFLAYSNSFNNSFHFDDSAYVTANPDIQISDLSPVSLISAARRSDVPRPLAMMGFAVNRYLAGDKVFSYHAVNFLIHLANTVLVFFLILTLLKSFTPSPSHPLIIALLAAAWWALLPMHVSAVTYIWQRITSAASLGFLLAVFGYAKWRTGDIRGSTPLTINGKWMALAGAVIAFGHKEISAVLPFVLILWDLFFVCRWDWEKIKKELPRFAALAAISAAVMVFYQSWHHGASEAEAAHQYLVYGQPPTYLERLLTEARVLCFYLGLMAFPHPSRLMLDFTYPISHGLLTPPSTLISMAAIAGFLIAAWVLRRRAPIVSFAILWFFGNCAIEALAPATDLAYEYRLYLPSVSGAFLLAWGLSFLFRHTGEGRYPGPKFLIPIFSLFLALLAFWTYQRNTVWATELALWQDNALKAPHNARAQVNYALNLTSAGKIDEASKAYEKAEALQPRYALIFKNHGVALFSAGRVEEAIAKYLKAMEIDPEDGAVYYNLGYAYFAKGDYKTSIETYSRGIQAKMPHDGIFLSLGNVYLKLGKLKEAQAVYEQGLQRLPQDSRLYMRRGDTLYLQGKTQEALEMYGAAYQLNPGNPANGKRLGMLQRFLEVRKEHPHAAAPAIVDLPTYWGPEGEK